ncbi:MAG: tripartite tricarboxylate transporter TctB family protein [Proteobacteria bacterium]|nr:tripartite tricarboxylate transporter TctB family protein [Pseudomonadota bacterium]MBU2226791.1 tripartite tricarboxylate transporter TctB family protein [Pseudomonadota bacterium]MBU2260663.1 tripartite tricarboxylate transporter TctB family protein [Pseudomonadota bacterium]
MRKAEIVVSLLFMLVGFIVIADSVRLGFMWGRTGPASGFFPFYLGVGVVIASLIVLLKAVNEYRKQGEGKPLMPPGALKPILWVVIPSTAMVAIMELVGLHIAAAMFLGFYMRVVGKIGWTTTLLVSIIAPLSLFITFDKLFLIPLPAGLWGGYLLRF